MQRFISSINQQIKIIGQAHQNNYIAGQPNMDRSRQTEMQAKMELLFYGQEGDQHRFNETLANPQNHLRSIEIPIYSNTVKLTNIRGSSKNIKLRTETQNEINENDILNSMKNKQNLKHILRKLESSPSPLKSKNKINSYKSKTINAQQSNPKKAYQPRDLTQRNPQINLFSYAYLIKEDQYIKKLIKNKIIEKIKHSQQKKTTKVNSGSENEKKQIKTLRQLQQINLRNKSKHHDMHKQKQKSLNHKNQEEAAKYIFSRKNSRVTLKSLLF